MENNKETRIRHSLNANLDDYVRALAAADNLYEESGRVDSLDLIDSVGDQYDAVDVTEDVRYLSSEGLLHIVPQSVDQVLEMNTRDLTSKEAGDTLEKAVEDASEESYIFSSDLKAPRDIVVSSEFESYIKGRGLEEMNSSYEAILNAVEARPADL